MKKIILILAILSISISNSFAQKAKKEIPIRFKIYLNGYYIETDQVEIGKITGTGVKTKHKLNNDFTGWFHIDEVYNMYITHPNYQTQKFTLSVTRKLKNKTVIIYLLSDKPDVDLGNITACI
jgi:hypothetical protein